MPIVTIQVIAEDSNVAYDDAVVQTLADELGKVFGSGPQGTWVRCDYLPRSQYAENEADIGLMQPTFVEIVKSTLGSEDALAAEALKVSQVVAAVLLRPHDNCHVIYAPPGAGRIAFGGNLLRSKDT